eukprot:1767314-Pleurochrysis_carterae.AAC.1
MHVFFCPPVARLCTAVLSDVRVKDGVSRLNRILDRLPKREFFWRRTVAQPGTNRCRSVVYVSDSSSRENQPFGEFSSVCRPQALEQQSAVRDCEYSLAGRGATVSPSTLAHPIARGHASTHSLVSSCNLSSKAKGVFKTVRNEAEALTWVVVFSESNENLSHFTSCIILFHKLVACEESTLSEKEKCVSLIATKGS